MGERQMSDRQISQADRVLNAFQQEVNSQGKPHYFENLKRVLDATPWLREQFNEATKGDPPALNRIVVSGGTPGKKDELNADAAYQDHTIFIRSNLLAKDCAHDSVTDMKFAFVLGHEMGHAVDLKKRNEELKNNQKSVDALLNTDGVRDYTDAIKKELNDHRNYEAQGQIAGWNAAMSYAREKDSTITPLQVANTLGLNNPKLHSHAESVFDKKTQQPWPDLTLEANGSISLSNTKNIEAMAKHFYDQPAERVRLGNAGTDYRNARAAELVAYIGGKESVRSFASGSYARLDLASLGLRRDDIQRSNLTGMSNPHFQLVDGSDKNAPKTMHFYSASEVPQGQLKVTKGLPGESKQELETATSQKFSQPDEAGPQNCKPKLDQGAVAPTSSVRPVYGSDLYQSLVGDMLNVSQQTRTQQQGPTQS